MVITLLSLLGGTACFSSSDDETCAAPAEWSYSCEPQASGDSACNGGPVVNGFQQDATNYYPVGCFSGFPYCTADGDVGLRHTCECSTAGSTTMTPEWACPL